MKHVRSHRDLFPKLSEIFSKRLMLFLFGNQAGVSLNFLQRNSQGIFLDTYDFMLASKFNYPNLEQDINKARTMYKYISKENESITNQRWNAGLQFFTLLFTIIKANKPKLVIETGIANGVSTYAIMGAINENSNFGALHSYDILPECRSAYKGFGSWNFHLLPKRNSHKQLFLEVHKIPKVDVWVHDSNHGYRWQKYEYLVAYLKLRKNGVLISDDVDASSAWGELIPKYFRKSFIIYDTRKFIGIALK